MRELFHAFFALWNVLISVPGDSWVDVSYRCFQVVCWKTIVLPIVALLVAALTGVTSFYRWESEWKGFRETQFTLEYLLAVWDLSIAQAKQEKDEQQAITLALAATRQLLDAAHVSTSSETEPFFQRAQIPQSQQSQ